MKLTISSCQKYEQPFLDFMVILKQTNQKNLEWIPVKYIVKTFDNLGLKNTSVRKKRKPEHKGKDNFYSKDTAKEYGRMAYIQEELRKKAIYLLNFNEYPKLLVDLGCGQSNWNSSQSNDIFIGCDLSYQMLSCVNYINNPLVQMDIFEPFPFRNQIFDGAISISVLQWAFSEESLAYLKLCKLFKNLSNILSKNGRAVFQFYPNDLKEINLIFSVIQIMNFDSALVVSNPVSTRGKKLFLCLSKNCNSSGLNKPCQ